MSEPTSYSRSIFIPMMNPIDREDSPPSYEEYERITKLESEFDGAWVQSENQPTRIPSRPVSPSADDESAPLLSVISLKDINTTADATLYQRWNERPVDVQSIVIDEPQNNDLDPSKHIEAPAQENEEEMNLFCTPKNSTLKGWCICFFSRIVMICVHAALYIYRTSREKKTRTS